MSIQKAFLFGTIAIQNNYITREQLDECIAIQWKLAHNGIKESLGDIAKKKGYMTEEQVRKVLEIQDTSDITKPIYFTDIAKQNLFVESAEIKRALEIQKKSAPEIPIGEIMVKEGMLNEQERQALLIAQNRIIGLSQSLDKENIHEEEKAKEITYHEAELEIVRKIAHSARLRVENHDPYTKDHCVRVAKWARIIAKRLPTFSTERIDKIEITALVHDLGKLDVPYEILNKRGPLSVQEFELIKKHPEFGAKRTQIISSFIEFGGILWHHLKYEGGGYPDSNMKGQEIPIEARIIAVADSFDAITSDRPYRKASTPQEALSIMRTLAGKNFDPNIVTIFEEYYLSQVSKVGYELGAQSLLIDVTLGEQVRTALSFLKSKIGNFDTKNPLAKVTDKEKIVREAINHLISLDINAEDAEKFVRYAYRLSLKETFNKDEILLSESELDKLRNKIKEYRSHNMQKHLEITLPLKAISPYLLKMKVIVYEQELWNFIIDGNNIILLK